MPPAPSPAEHLASSSDSEVPLAVQAEEYVPLPKGEVHKKKEIVQVGTGGRLPMFAYLYTSGELNTTPLAVSGRDAARLGLGQCAAPRRPRHNVGHGADDEVEEDRNHGQAAAGNQQGAQPSGPARAARPSRPPCTCVLHHHM